MEEMKSLSVFFPAYNEEDNIANTVSRAVDVIKTLKLDNWEVIVVDDGSSDNTATVVQKLVAKNPKIRLIRHQKNRGYGAALKTGFSSAKFDWIAFTDSDGQFDFHEINKFLSSIKSHQVIVGYRRRRSDSKFRRTMAFLLRVWDTVLFGLNLKDVDCGFKLIKKSVVTQVFPLVTESAITETEMMAKIHRLGYPIREIGVTHHSRTEGVQTGGNFKVIFKAAAESFKLFLHLNPLFTALAAILTIASFLRLWRLRDYLVFLGDEGRDMLVWFNMVYKHEFTFLGPTASVGGFYLGPIYYYLALPFYYFIRDPVGPAVFVALTGILTVWLIYRVCQKWFGSIAAIFAAWTYAVAALIIRYSRASWNPNPVPFFTLLGVYLSASPPADKYYRLKLIAAGICLGILFQLHYLTIILAPIFAAIVIYQGWRRKSSGLERAEDGISETLEEEPDKTLMSSSVGWRRRRERGFLAERVEEMSSRLAVLILGWVIGFFPFLAFEIYHNFPNIRTVIEFVSRPSGAVLNFEPLGLIRSIVRNTARLYQTVLTWSDNPLTHFVAYTTVISATLISIKRKVYAPLIWFYPGIIIFSLYQGSISDYYYGFLFPLPFIFIAVSAQYLSRHFPAGKPLVLLLISLLTLDQSRRWFLNNQPNRLLNQTETVAQKVIDLSGSRSYNLALITNGNSDHAYRYFLEILRFPPTPLSSQITGQLIAVCEKSEKECQPLGNPIWEIAGFGRAEINTQVTVPPGITVYRLVHYNEQM